jgi:hypothetical protein
MSDRAQRQSLGFAPPIFPDTLREYVEKNDPAGAPFRTASRENPFFGKRILVLSGAVDELVPWSASKAFFDHLEVGPGGVKALFLQEGKGHECTVEMVQKLAERVWQWSLKA